MDKKVKLLCVGIGGYANIYLDSLLKNPNPDFEIAGMVDIAPECSDFYDKLCSMGVPLYQNMEDFYAEHSADLAIITTPIYLHKRQIMCALKNGSNVMCEKPLSGASADAEDIGKLSKQTGKFVMIGYQWSYSEAINSLKADILNGLYGKPVFLKSLVSWPRPKGYFTRGSGWAGKLRAADGTVMNDSVANNATAHYLHNMLYVTGAAVGKSSEAVSLECDLSRVNNIENFDTAVAKFTLDNGAECLLAVSHATGELVDPMFEYRFEKGTVTFNSEQKDIIGNLDDGTVKNYGDPFKDINEKIYEAIAAVNKKDYTPPCSEQTAAAQVRCIEKMQQNPVYDIKSEYIVCRKDDTLYAEGLHSLLLRCYNEERLLSEFDEYRQMVGI